MSARLVMLLVCSAATAGTGQGADTPVGDAPATAGDKPRLLVLDFTASLGANPELAKVLTSVVVTQMTQMGGYAVSSSADLATLLGVEQQKQLTGCGEDSCMAEIAGALGAEWVVSGNISTLDESSLLTLRLIDAKAARLDNQLNKTLPEERDAMPEAMRVAAYQLMRLPVPPREDESPWYTSPWVWIGVGLGAIGLGVGSYFLFQPEAAPAGPLGNVVLDAP